MGAETADNTEPCEAETSLTVIHTVELDQHPVVFILPGLDHPEADDKVAILKSSGRQVQRRHLTGDLAERIRTAYERAHAHLQNDEHVIYYRIMCWVHETLGI